jgi:hypothetical protein
MEWRPGLTHDLWRTRKSHGPESIIEDVGVTNLHRTVTSHIGTPGSFRRIHIDEFGAYQASDDLADVEMRYHQMQRAEIEPRLGWDFTS